MAQTAQLDSVAPTTLIEARDMAHNAVQIAALAALANVEERPDYSHTALQRDPASGGFQTNTMQTTDGPVMIRVTLSPLSMWLVRGGETVATIELDDQPEANCIAWLDEMLTERGLKAASGVKHPFKLPADVAAIEHFSTDGLESALQVLSRWYDLAHHQLLRFADRHRDIEPGPSPVWCWPHHFDMATYVSLEAGDAEDARGIGTGMSPGDESYSEPYFYINPWPYLDAGNLPQLPPPGHWHTEGFVGAVATASQILELPHVDRGLSEFIEGAFVAGRQGLTG